MKKKLFAFALACVAFGSDATSSSAQGSFISQDAFTKSTSPSRPLPNIKNQLNLYSIVDRGLTIFDNVCGGYELLLSRAYALQHTAPQSPMVAAANDINNVTLAEAYQDRPPTLELPTSSDPLPTHPALESQLHGYVTAALASIENGALLRIQHRILQETPYVFECIHDFQTATLQQTTKLFAKSYASSMSHSELNSTESLHDRIATSNGLLLATDPIRSRSLLEEYQAYDLTFHDRLWIQRMHHQHQSAEPTSEDPEILNSFIAASEAMCSAANPNRVAEAIPSDLVSPVGKVANGTSYFVRKIPIDYSFSTVPSIVRQVAPDNNSHHVPALDYPNPQMLSSVFGSHVVPVVDFNTSRLSNLSIRWTVPKVPATEVLHHEAMASASVPVSDRNNSEREDAQQISRDLSRLIRGAAKVAVRDLRIGLSQMQNWLDRFEVALADNPADAKVAASSNSARTNE